MAEGMICSLFSSRFVNTTTDLSALGDELGLCINDLGRVYEHLIDTSPRWYELGLQLDVPPTELNKIRYQYGDPNVCLREMLMYWLKQTESPPSWSALVTALRRRSVGENVLALKLEQLELTNKGRAAAASN